MSPKFIEVTHFGSDTTELVNPRRVSRIYENKRYSAHPDVYTGTWIEFYKTEKVLIKETKTDVKRLLK